MFDQARIHGMKQIDCFVYYNSNSKEADDDADDDIIFHDTFQVESANFDTDDDNDEPISYREIINKDFNTPTGFEEVTIVMVVFFMHNIVIAALTYTTSQFKSMKIILML